MAEVQFSGQLLNELNQLMLRIYLTIASLDRSPSGSQCTCEHMQIYSWNYYRHGTNKIISSTLNRRCVCYHADVRLNLKKL